MKRVTLTLVFALFYIISFTQSASQFVAKGYVRWFVKPSSTQFINIGNLKINHYNYNSLEDLISASKLKIGNSHIIDYKTALEKGYLEIKFNKNTFSVINYQNQPIDIVINKNDLDRVVSGNTSINKRLNYNFEEYIVKPKRNLWTHKAINWKDTIIKQQIILNILGYYNGNLIGETNDSFDSAFFKFFEDKKIKLRSKTKREYYYESSLRELNKEVIEIIKIFKYLGYYSEENSENIHKLKSTISEFQSVNGLSVTSRIDNETETKIEIIIQQRRKNLYSLGFIDNIDSQDHLSEKILEFGKLHGKKSLREAETFLNDTIHNINCRIQNLAFGNADLGLLDNIKTVERYLGVEETGKYVSIQTYIDYEYGLISAVIRNNLDNELIENNFENSRYHFIENETYRVILKTNEKHWELVEVNLVNGFVTKRVNENSAIGLFEDAINTKVSNQSDNEIEFIYVNQNKLPDNKVKIQAGKREIILAKEEFSGFVNGDTETIFGESSQFSENIVILRPAFEPKSTYDLNNFNKNTNRTFKNNKKHVYFSSCLTRAKENFINLPTIRKAEDVGICVSDNSQIKDYGVIKKVEKKLNKNNIESVSVGENAKSNILIVTGHRDVEFKKYLNSLASSNTVKDKYIVLFSCYEDGIQAFNTNLISQGNAKAILFFPVSIHPNAVQSVLKEFNKAIEKGQLNRKVDEILQESIEKAIERAQHPRLKGEILKMKDAQIQLTFNQNILQSYENVV